MEQKINNENEVLSVQTQTQQTEEKQGKPVLSPEAMRSLAEMKKYMNIMFILHYIVAGLIILGVITAFIEIMTGAHILGMRGARFSLVFDIGVAVAIFFIGSLLRDAVRACEKFDENPHDVKNLEAVIRYQSGYWKLTIIVLIVVVSIILLYLLMGLLKFIMAGRIN
jgi:hypothetical protein